MPGPFQTQGMTEPISARPGQRVLDRSRAPMGPGERNEFQDLVLQSVGHDLPMFGYNLFQHVPSTFAPVDRVPVTQDYVVGPGDELLIRGWGGVDIDYRAIVDRDGAIVIPRVGAINVAGIRFQDLHAYLKTAIGRSFRNFDLNVTLGQLRSIQVFVVGEAVRPGAYTLSSLSTLINAVFASGGPTPKGSMRAIQLKRRDKVVTEFDMYDLLLKGDKSKDAPLLSGDVIYLPPIGPLTAISGSINKPAIYELRGATSLGTLLQFAGGLATTAHGEKVLVERIVGRKIREAEEFSLDNEGLAHPVRDGDLVQVLRLSPRFGNVVTVRGNVAQPARHPWRPGMRVRDVVPTKESLIVPDYWVRQNLVVRPDVTGRDAHGLRLELAYDLRQGSQANANELFQQPRIDVRQSLAQVNWDYAVIERINFADLTSVLIPFNLGRALEGDSEANVLLQPADVITVFSKADIEMPIAKQTKFVRLEGEVAVPGIYQVQPGETLDRLLTRVGGFTPNAYVFGSTFTRESTRALQQQRLEEMVDRLERDIRRNQSQVATTKEDSEALKAASQAQLALVERLRQVKATGRIVLKIPPTGADHSEMPPLVLEDGDTFRVPPRPSTVAVMGTVYNENAFVYMPGMRVSDYLHDAGGPTKDADTDGFYIVRANGSVVSKRQSSGFFQSSFESERLMPGDTVIVPEKLDRFRFTRELKDWSQIFYQFALGVAGLKVLRDL